MIVGAIIIKKSMIAKGMRNSPRGFFIWKYFKDEGAAMVFNPSDYQ